MCDGCSRSRVLLNHVDQNAPVRVCDKCRDGMPDSAGADRPPPNRRLTTQISFNSLLKSSTNSRYTADLFLVLVCTHCSHSIAYIAQYIYPICYHVQHHTFYHLPVTLRITLYALSHGRYLLASHVCS